MSSIRDKLSGIVGRFSDLKGWVTDEFYSLTLSLQQRIAEVITALVENAMKPILTDYISEYGQKGFDRLVREDRDLVAMIEKYRPSYLFYLNLAKEVKKYMSWNNERFADSLKPFLEEKGISVNEEGYDYLLRTVDRFREKIYT